FGKGDQAGKGEKDQDDDLPGEEKKPAGEGEDGPDAQDVFIRTDPIGTAQSQKGVALIVNDARLMPVERYAVPSERDCKLLYLAREVGKNERVPADKLIEREVPRLFLEVSQSEYAGTRVEDREAVINKKADGSVFYRYYRAATENDQLLPGRTRIFSQKIRLRKLDKNDRVKKGMLLAVINPALALED